VNTSVGNEPKNQHASVPTIALAKAVDFDEEMVHATLTDGRIIRAPLVRFPLLNEGTSA